MRLSLNFRRFEFECGCGCGFDTVDAELITVLEDVREQYNSPIAINSGARCKEHNYDVGGSKDSQHLYGKAADFVVVGVHASDVADYLDGTYPDTYGIGRYTGRTHIDVREDKARWTK